MYTVCIDGYIQVNKPHLILKQTLFRSLNSVNLLYPSTVIEATWHARTQMAFALANQFFGCFITMRSWFEIFELNEMDCWFFLRRCI